MFVVQAGVCLVVALVLVGVLAAGRSGGRGGPAVALSWVAALLVAAGSLTAVLVNPCVDVGRIGPLPNMYETAWYGLSLDLVSEPRGVSLSLVGASVIDRLGSCRRGSLPRRAAVQVGAAPLVVIALVGVQLLRPAPWPP